MMTNRQSRITFLVLLGVSIFFHLIAWKWLSVKEWITTEQVKKSADTTVQITLQQTPEPAPIQKPLIEEQPITDPLPETEAHQPLHNADVFASSNNTDKSVKTVTPGMKPKNKASIEEAELTAKDPNPIEPKPSKEPDVTEVSEEVSITSEAPVTEQPETITAKANNKLKHEKPPIEGLSSDNNDNDSHAKPVKDASLEETQLTAKNESQNKPEAGGSLSTEFQFQESSTQIPDEMLAALGNMELLDDHNLSGIDVKDPFSEVESERIKMINRYLQRMEKQIKTGWVKPKKKNQQYSGVIKFSLTPYGQLTEAYIYLGSGDSELDQSALEAVKQVKRFAVPESALVAAKYYNSLRFHYSSHDYAGETIPLMP